MTKVIECEIWCYSTKHEALGLQEENSWQPFMIRADRINAIKSTGSDDDSFAGSNKAVIYFQGDSVVSNVDYNEMRMIWEKMINKEND